MVKIVSRRAGAVLALAAGLCVAAALPAPAQDFRFRYDDDERGNVEGKRASCEVYAKIAQVQIDANRKYNCGYNGSRWDHGIEQSFRWCRHVPREDVIRAVRERAGDLQRCFNNLGDFDEEAMNDHR